MHLLGTIFSRFDSLVYVHIYYIYMYTYTYVKSKINKKGEGATSVHILHVQEINIHTCKWILYYITDTLHTLPVKELIVFAYCY